jgi:hypothetical protein
VCGFDDLLHLQLHPLHKNGARVKKTRNCEGKKELVIIATCGLKCNPSGTDEPTAS